MAKKKKTPEQISTRVDFDLAQTSSEWIIGLDEVGWGCIAGPLLLGAVAIHREQYAELLKLAEKYPLLHEIRDSKQVKPETRQKIKNLIEKLGLSKLQVSIGEESVEFINKHALSLTFDSCVEKIFKQFTFDLKTAHVILDGSRVPTSLKKYQNSLVIKGDDKSLAIGLASIIAKETRDAIMDQLDLKYPVYKWKKNKGYGAPEHIAGLKSDGLSPHHRIGASTKILEPK